MFLLHYIIPVALYKFFKDKVVFWGLLLANLIDLDHIYLRLIGKVGWFGSACDKLGKQCSFNLCPFHCWIVFVIALVLCLFLFFGKKSWKLRFIGWLGLGLVIHFAFDYLHFLIGFGI
jgi:hypothetical protein